MPVSPYAPNPYRIVNPPHRLAGTADEFGMMKFSVLYSVDTEKQMTPTFWTPILSRRYAIECKLSFPESAVNTLEITLPLQVLYGEVQSVMPKKY